MDRTSQVITQLSDSDCFYISERYNKLLPYPVHCHAEYELNFTEHGKGAASGFSYPPASRMTRAISSTSDTPRCCEVKATVRLGGSTVRRLSRLAPCRSV